MVALRGVPYKENMYFFARGQIFCADRCENLHDGIYSSVPYVGFSIFVA